MLGSGYPTRSLYTRVGRLYGRSLAVTKGDRGAFRYQGGVRIIQLVIVAKRLRRPGSGRRDRDGRPGNRVKNGRHQRVQVTRHLGLTVQRRDPLEYSRQVRAILGRVRNRVRARRETCEVRDLYRVRSTYYHFLQSRKGSVEVAANFRRERPTDRGGVNRRRQVVVAYRLNQGGRRYARHVRSRSRRRSYFVKVFAGGRNYQRDRNGVASVGYRLRRDTLDGTRPRGLKRDLCRKVNSIVNGSPRNGTAHGRGGEGGSRPYAVSRRSFLLYIFRRSISFWLFV